MNISAEEFHIHFISYANIPFKQQGIYFAGNLSEIQEILGTTFKLTMNGRKVL